MAPMGRTARMTAATALMGNATSLQESASVIRAFMGLCKCQTSLISPPYCPVRYSCKDLHVRTIQIWEVKAFLSIPSLLKLIPML